MAMASSYSPSSSQEPANPTSTARRLPPPCWSDEETVALIDAYRDKWYFLRRGHLRAPHWQEVADGVAAQCPSRNPPKTSIQCRHKMEKLRKRYRSEIQRTGNTPNGNRHPSAWIHFKKMDSMELGFSSNSDPSDDPIHEGEDENENKSLLYAKGIKQSIPIHLNRRYNGSIGDSVVAGNGNRIRINIPNIAAVRPPSSDLKVYKSNGSSENGAGFGGMKDEDDVMVAAMGKLGDGILKVERMKMDTAREVESMRIKMEVKRTEMMLEWLQKVVDLFLTVVMEKKKKEEKVKRMGTP